MPHLMALCCLVMKLILLSLLFKNHPPLTFLGPCTVYTSPIRPSTPVSFPFRACVSNVSVPLVVFPVLNYIQDVDILLSFQDPGENTFLPMYT